ncbi:MAG: class I SAM-dependent methyltransferase [Candidatus Deferrimicrobium sp.]
MTASTKRAAAKNPSEYFRHPRPEMLAFLPSGAATALDVGCGEGVFGGLAKQRLRAEVWGIERDRAAADAARSRIDRVLCGDLVLLVDELPDAYFDCIVFNDVLEHLADPFAILSRVKGKVSRHGVIVCSIPNVRYFYTLKGLLVDKQWKYEEDGVLDRTHLRFFTMRSVRDMFLALGYEVLTLQGIHPMVSWKFHLLNLLACGNLSDARYVQIACVARPA